MKRSVSLNIKSREVHALAAELAKLQGTSITRAVLNALKEALRRQKRRPKPADEVARMECLPVGCPDCRSWIIAPKMRFSDTVQAGIRRITEIWVLAILLADRLRLD